MLAGRRNVLLSLGIIGLAFTTPPRLVAPSALSKVLTVQTRDASGQASKLVETADLTLTSTSPTGEFVNDKGGKLSLTMSRGSANRNFYYRDSRAGVYAITAKVAGRDSGQVWPTTQMITVGVIQTPDVKYPKPNIQTQTPKSKLPTTPITHTIEIKKPAGFWSWLVALLF